jgi:hypothetical protein
MSTDQQSLITRRLLDILSPDEDEVTYEMLYRPSNHYDWVTDQLAVGGSLRHLSEIDKAVADGIKLVVDNRIEQSCPNIWRDAGVLYIHNGVNDDGKAKPDWFWQMGVNVAAAMTQDPDFKVLTHCAAGMNRGPAIGYIILRCQDYTGDQAHRMLKQARPCVWNDYRYDADNFLAGISYTRRRRLFRDRQLTNHWIG